MHYSFTKRKPRSPLKIKRAWLPSSKQSTVHEELVDMAELQYFYSLIASSGTMLIMQLADKILISRRPFNLTAIMDMSRNTCQLA